MRKFLDVDIIESLRAIVERNTLSWQSDFFQYDVDTIRTCAHSDIENDKYLLWMSRPTGTWCFAESKVFLQDTFENYTWRFYGNDDRILTFAIEIGAVEDGAVRGHLYQLDYPQHITHVWKSSIPVDAVALTFGDGHVARVPMERHAAQIATLEEQHGKFAGRVYELKDETAMQRLLVREHRTRMAFPARTMDWFIKVMDRDPPPLAQMKKDVPLEKGIMLIDTRSQHFNTLDIDNRRFMYNPTTGSLILGFQYAGKTIQQSHAYEHGKSGTKEPYDDFVRGWVGTSRQYKDAVIHFAPAIDKANVQAFGKGFDTASMFHENNANENTVIRGFGDAWEQPLSKMLGAGRDVPEQGHGKKSAERPASVRAKLAQAKQDAKDTPAEPGKKKGRDMCK